MTTTDCEDVPLREIFSNRWALVEYFKKTKHPFAFGRLLFTAQNFGQVYEILAEVGVSLKKNLDPSTSGECIFFVQDEYEALLKLLKLALEKKISLSSCAFLESADTWEDLFLELDLYMRDIFLFLDHLRDEMVEYVYEQVGEPMRYQLQQHIHIHGLQELLDVDAIGIVGNELSERIVLDILFLLKVKSRTLGNKKNLEVLHSLEKEVQKASYGDYGIEVLLVLLRKKLPQCEFFPAEDAGHWEYKNHS